MSDADAIVLFRPRSPEALMPFLDLDDDNEESEGIYAEALEDGSFLLHTFQPFSVFAENAAEAHDWLEQFGDSLPEVHDDPRGLLFFPDSAEPDAQTYDGVVAEIGDHGVWIATTAVIDAELAGHVGEDLPQIDMQALQAIAGQLLGGAADGSGQPASPFAVAKMFEDIQQQLLASLGLEGMGQEVVEHELVEHEPPQAPGSSPAPDKPRKG